MPRPTSDWGNVMSAETADHEAELEKLCERLEARNPVEFLNRVHSGDAINPDGPEAARLLREMAAEIASLQQAVARAEANESIWSDIAEQRTALTKGKPHD